MENLTGVVALLAILTVAVGIRVLAPFVTDLAKRDPRVLWLIIASVFAGMVFVVLGISGLVPPWMCAVMLALLSLSVASYTVLRSLRKSERDVWPMADAAARDEIWERQRLLGETHYSANAMMMFEAIRTRNRDQLRWEYFRSVEELRRLMSSEEEDAQAIERLELYVRVLQLVLDLEMEKQHGRVTDVMLELLINFLFFGLGVVVTGILEN